MPEQNVSGVNLATVAAHCLPGGAAERAFSDLSAAGRALKRAAPVDSRPSELVAMDLFQKWAAQMSAAGRLSPAGDKAYLLDYAGSFRFCMGFYDGRIFLGVQEEEMEWFRRMVWLHVAVRPGSQRLNFVTEKVNTGREIVPGMALQIDTGSELLVRMVSRCHYLDVRTVESKEAGLSFCDDSRSFDVSRKVSMVMEVFLVKEETHYSELLGGRCTTGYTHRSVFTKVFS